MRRAFKGTCNGTSPAKGISVTRRRVLTLRGPLTPSSSRGTAQPDFGNYVRNEVPAVSRIATTGRTTRSRRELARSNPSCSPLNGSITSHGMVRGFTGTVNPVLPQGTRTNAGLSPVY